MRAMQVLSLAPGPQGHELIDGPRRGVTVHVLGVILLDK